MFVNLEIQPGFIQKRLLAVTEKKEVTLSRGQLEFWNLRGYATDYSTLIPTISERVRNSGYSLIVLDPIYTLHGGTDENSAGDVAM